jgi:hypothetical protein
MAVWSDDYFSVPISEIKDLFFTAVIVNGIVYQDDLTNVNVQRHLQVLDDFRFIKPIPILLTAPFLSIMR